MNSPAPRSSKRCANAPLPAGGRGGGPGLDLDEDDLGDRAFAQTVEDDEVDNILDTPDEKILARIHAGIVCGHIAFLRDGRGMARGIGFGSTLEKAEESATALIVEHGGEVLSFERPAEAGKDGVYRVRFSISAPVDTPCKM